FENPDRRFVAVATNLETGKPVYFEKGKCTDIFKAVQASATVPYISKPVEIDGDQYLDGGLSVRVPYEWALAEGYEKIVVIRTRDRAYRKKIAGPLAINKMYRKLPEAVYDLDEQNARYNISLNGLDQLENSGRIFVLAPEKPITIRRFESDMDKLGDLYWQGYHETKEHLDALRQYLALDK
ncbi:MAG: patatin family protein, partial [Lactimicrobium massiliense]